MKKCEDFLLGVVTKDGYYPINQREKVITKKTANLPEGAYLKHNFETTTHQEIADFLEIPLEVWVKEYLEA